MTTSLLLAIIQFWEGRQGGGYGSFNYEHYCKVALAKANLLTDNITHNGKEEKSNTEEKHGEDNSKKGNAVIIKIRC